MLVDGEAAEPIGFSAVGGGGVVLHAAEDVAGHGCSDREGRGTEEHQEEQEADRRGSGVESSRGNTHALVVEDGEGWRLLCFVGGFAFAFCTCGGDGQWKKGNGRTGVVGRGGVRPSAPQPSGAVAGHVQGRVEATPRGDAWATAVA